MLIVHALDRRRVGIGRVGTREAQYRVIGIRASVSVAAAAGLKRLEIRGGGRAAHLCYLWLGQPAR